ncbi:MAG: G8 domain-containing protein [Gammaproteobacteria bacterium]
MPSLSAGARVVLCGIPAGLILFLVAGCNNGTLSDQSPTELSASSYTSIASCVVDAQKDVVIGGPDAPPGCTTVEMEPSAANPSAFGEIRVENGGVLLITAESTKVMAKGVAAPADSIPFATLETPVHDICIEDGGKVEYGTEAKPITSANKVVLEFLGKPGDGSTTPACKGFAKGIDVTSGGSLLMYGAKGVPGTGGVSWTTLAQPAGTNVAGAKVASTGTETLQLTADVTKGAEPWQYGDWIVVGTTSYSPFETEFVQIASVLSNPNGGSTVTLLQPLKHYHFGSLAPSSASATCQDPLDSQKTQPAFLCDGADQNYGVDERAEVGLISRDIELTADTSEADNLHWGGEIMIHAGFKQVAIQGVRLSKFGKDQLGSYPIHFHMVGDAANKPLVNADSVDHSYNKCVTIHDTANVTISNLVCARIVGHIFYEELNSTTAADDSGITFKNDLGLGAMSNSFDINPVTVNGTTISRQQLIADYWWTGDYMTNDSTSPNYIGYDGFNIPDTDNWLQPTHGSCTAFDPGGGGGFAGQAPDVNTAAGATAACPPKDSPTTPIYIEPASGFWIQNPNTNLIGNAIAGCQGVGRGYWWVPPPTPIDVNGSQVTLGFEPLGTFENNRASACYSGFYGEPEYTVKSQVMTPHAEGAPGGEPVVAAFDGMTATRNRFRGVWLRPVWFVIENGHFASNRENVSMVTSGGIDGNAPGVWDLLEDSVIVGFSQNNVDRWGPCPTAGQLGPYTGSQFGCIDHTPPPTGQAPHSGDEMGLGYTPPSWNDFGYMLYDGPVRVFHDRFVNFNYDDPTGTDNEFSSELDTADQQFLANYSSTNQSPTGQGPPTPYEGDAAFGWFQSNQSAYPTGTAVRELIWTNTNLRHQVYTQLVGVNTNFNDGDKNTAIIDEDGTLSGFGVKLAPNAGSSPVHAISLNNLPFNSTSNAVDECLSRGGQNEAFEGRTSALMSPSSMGTLEFSTLYPFVPDPAPAPQGYPGNPNTHWQDMTFTRDDQVPDGKGGMFHPDMTLQTGRNGLGIWEPKVANGYGYTVTVKPTTSPSVPPSQDSHKAGIWKWIDVGVADVVDPNISAAHPFYIRLGISYTNTDGTHPADNFTIIRGYKSYTGGSVTPIGDLLNYWTPQACNNLDANNTANIPWSGDNFQGNCPSGPTTTLAEASSIAGLTNGNGTPNLGVYYYDQTSGYLYLNVAQDEPNPVAPSPLGSCHADGTGDTSCPDFEHGESYYVCPKNGCIIYTIAQNDPAYAPGSSTGQPDPADALPAPANQNQLVVNGTDTVITRTEELDKTGVPYYVPTNATACTETEPQ